MNIKINTLLGIFVFVFLHINISSADHYKKGMFFSDPYVIGCIYDLLDASFGKKCAHRSMKYYFHEGKHRGSLNEAYRKCRNELMRIGSRKYRNFNLEDYSVECNE